MVGGGVGWGLVTGNWVLEWVGLGWVGWVGGELMLDIDAYFDRPLREFSLGRARSCHRSDHLGAAQCRVSYLHTLKVGF